MTNSAMKTAPSSSPDASEIRRNGTGTPLRAREVVFLICWLVACGGLMFWRSFHVAFGFDDINHLHALAAMRTGEFGFMTWLFHQHNEHIVPLLRLYFLVATRISGLSSAALHVLIFLNYVVGAFACTWICFSFTGSRLAAFLAGTIFVGAGGFCGSIVWQPTDAQFAVAGTPLILAMAILVSPQRHRRWADAAVLLLIVVAATGMGAIAVAALSIPLYLLLAKSDLVAPGRRRWMIILTVLLIAAILLGTRWLMALHGVHGPKFAAGALFYGLFLVLLPPGRFLLAWTPLGNIALPVAVAMSVLGWLLLFFSLRWIPKSLRRLLLALWVGNGLLALLIGIGRYKIFTYPDLFETDRYHYFFLLPLALQTAVLLDRWTRRLLHDASPKRKAAVAGVLGCAMLAALVMSHIRLDKTMMWFAIDQFQLDFREAKVLAKIVHREATTQTLHLVDGPIRFPGGLNVHLGLSCIVFTQFPKGLPGIRWSLSRTPTPSVGWPYRVTPLSDADAAVQNRIFDEWSKMIDRPPYSCVIQGTIQDVFPVNSCAEAAKMSPPPIAPPRPFF